MGKRVCKADGCGEKHYSLGWCRKHYSRMSRNGTLEPKIVFGVPKPDCLLFAECGNKARSHKSGYCHTHLRRIREYGDPTILLTAPYGSRVNAVCTAGNCDEPVQARSMCHKHYEQWHKAARRGTCSVEGCERRERSVGLCEAHYINGPEYRIGDWAAGPPTWLYLLQRHGEQKVGVTRSLKQRMQRHQSNGWELVDVINTEEALALETEIRRWLASTIGTQPGSPEIWATANLEVATLAQLLGMANIHACA